MSASLVSLPAETLGHIATYIHLENVRRMMLCGSKLLNKKMMGQGGVWNISSGRTGGQEPSWSFLRSFANLKSLTVVLSPAKTALQGMVLPKTLTTLDVFMFWDDRRLDWHKTFLPLVTPTSLPSLQSFRIGGLRQSLSDLEWTRLPKSLTAIHVNSVSWTESALAGLVFASLFPSLTSLELPSYGQFCLKALGSLPSTLETLNVCLLDKDTTELPASFAALPLTHLTFYTGREFNKATIQLLPMTLRYLDIHGKFAPDAVSALPLRLEHLILSNNVPMAQLPRGLKTLRMSGYSSAFSFEGIPPALEKMTWNWTSGASCTWVPFPETLTVMEIDSYYPFQEANLVHLPPSITQLRLPGVQFSENGVKMLPPRLRQLVINGSKADLRLESIKYLPKMLQYFPHDTILMNDESIRLVVGESLQGLTHFDIHAVLPNVAKSHGFPVSLFEGHEVKSSLTLQCLAYLPDTVKSIALNFGVNFDEASLPDHLPPFLEAVTLPSCRNFTSACLARFPSTLTWLDLSSSTFSDDFVQNKGENLKHLWLSTVCLTSPSLVKALSTDIVELNAETLKSTFMTKMIDGLQLKLTQEFSGWVEDLQDAAFAAIPRHITRVCLSGAHISDLALSSLPETLTDLRLAKAEAITDAAIAKLPRSLCRLDLPWSALLSDACIPSLPRNLTHLDIGYAADITDACFKHLPRTLTYLDVGATTLIYDDGIADLPPSLLTLHAAYSSCTEDCMKHLPRTITELDFGDSENFEDVEAKDLPLSLQKIRWKWTLENYKECMKVLENLTVPDSVLVFLGLKPVESYWKYHIQAPPQ